MFYVQGRTTEGQTVYYTGKAGSGFISLNLSEAFSYSSLEGARKRATMLNAGRETHGVHFMVPIGEGQPEACYIPGCTNPVTGDIPDGRKHCGLHASVMD